MFLLDFGDVFLSTPLGLLYKAILTIIDYISLAWDAFLDSWDVVVMYAEQCISYFNMVPEFMTVIPFILIPPLMLMLGIQVLKAILYGG